MDKNYEEQQQRLSIMAQISLVVSIPVPSSLVFQITASLAFGKCKRNYNDFAAARRLKDQIVTKNKLFRVKIKM